MNSEDDAFRIYLNTAYLKKRARNSSYSLRAFSNLLQLDQSYVSKLLAGKRNMSPDLQRKCLEILNVPREEIEVVLSGKLPMHFNFNYIEEDVFNLIQEWWHFAILELLKLKGFKQDYSYIARRLGISVENATLAVERLFTHGFLDCSDDEWILVSPRNTWADFEKSSKARMKLQESLHLKNLDALKNVPFHKREHSSLTVAVDSCRLPEFKKAMMDFLTEFDLRFQDGEKNEVYQLTLGFFPLSKDD